MTYIPSREFPIIINLLDIVGRQNKVQALQYNFSEKFHLIAMNLIIVILNVFNNQKRKILFLKVLFLNYYIKIICNQNFELNQMIIFTFILSKKLEINHLSH